MQQEHELANIGATDYYADITDPNNKATVVNINCTSSDIWSPVETDLDWCNIKPIDRSVCDYFALSKHLDNPARILLARVPVPSTVILHISTNLKDFEDLWQNDAGSATLLDRPRRFLLQTPNDADFFCSMVVKSNTFFDMEPNAKSPEIKEPFSATIISSDAAIQIAKIVEFFSHALWWDLTDLPMAVLPLEFLVRHTRTVSDTLARLTLEISTIERIIINDEVQPVDGETSKTSKGLIRRLHICNRDIVKLHRRWHFQVKLASTILELVRRYVLSAAFISHKKMTDIEIIDFDYKIKEIHEYQKLLGLASLQSEIGNSLKYDLDVIPTRIANQFNAIFNLIAQNDAQASMSLAETTLRDSSSMKTIAVLTMVFLPGTFICSFFSMTMFNWNNQPGERLVSPYIWAYFVAMVPLTMLVISVWWLRTSDSHREQKLVDEKCRAIALAQRENGTVQTVMC